MHEEITGEAFRQLVYAAAQHPERREELREAMVPFVERAIRTYLIEKKLSPDLTHTLVNVGMRPFDQALNAYVRNWVENYPNNDFRAYYRWWMRQEIVGYLNEGR